MADCLQALQQEPSAVALLVTTDVCEGLIPTALPVSHSDSFQTAFKSNSNDIFIFFFNARSIKEVVKVTSAGRWD